MQIKGCINLFPLISPYDIFNTSLLNKSIIFYKKILTGWEEQDLFEIEIFVTLYMSLPSLLINLIYSC